MAATERLVHINDLLPPVVQGDPEVKVTRQRGVTHEGAAMQDPFANLPVIQVDPEIKVTRQKGIVHVDAGAGMVRMDRPAPPAGTDPKVHTLAGLQRSDRPVRAKEDQVQPGVPASSVPSFHEPVAGGVEKVTRQGVKTAAQAEKFLGADVLKADERAPGVQISPQVMTDEGRLGGLTPELIEAYRRNKVVAVDTPAVETRAKPVSFADQQMDQGDWKPVAGGVVQASRKSAETGKPAVPKVKAQKAKKRRSTKRRVRAGASRPAPRPAAPAGVAPSVDAPGAKAPEAVTEAKAKVE